ncbi:heparan-alpha-glucosaminide N-acetyltransferase-like, partial [Argonauta hians]
FNVGGNGKNGASNHGYGGDVGSSSSHSVGSRRSRSGIGGAGGGGFKPHPHHRLGRNAAAAPGNGGGGGGLMIKSKRPCVKAAKTSSMAPLTLASEEQLRWIESYRHRNDTPELRPALNMAWLTINSSVHFNIQLFMQTTQCYKCPLILINEAPGKETSTFYVSSNEPFIFHLAKGANRNNVETICNVTYHFRERGDYWMFVNYTSYTNSFCEILLANEPTNQNYPVLFVFGGLILTSMVWSLLKLIYRSRQKETSCCRKRPHSVTSAPAGIEHSTEMGLNAEANKERDVEKCVEFASETNKHGGGGGGGDNSKEEEGAGEDKEAEDDVDDDDDDKKIDPDDDDDDGDGDGNGNGVDKNGGDDDDDDDDDDDSIAKEDSVTSDSSKSSSSSSSSNNKTGGGGGGVDKEKKVCVGGVVGGNEIRDVVGGCPKKGDEIDVMSPSAPSATTTTTTAPTCPHPPRKEHPRPIPSAPVLPKKRKRLASLDTLRGIAISVMIFVNYGGGGYQYFEHAQWNGLTVADLVFPWFIFIMGTALNFSFRTLLRQKVSKWWIAVKIFRRATILFALGIWLNTAWGPVELKSIRIPGVLQRFSLTYLVLALIVTAFAREEDPKKMKQLSPFRDILLYWPEWFINLAILGVHIGITFALPVPGCPTGYLGPGGISEDGRYYNCTGGAAQYVDRMVLGEAHLYQHPTIKETYKTKRPFDPEGILGIPTSIFLCFLGLQAGRIILQYSSHKERIFRWTVYTIVTGAIAAALCMTSLNDGVIPINKNLWSVSFVLVNACFAFLLLTGLYVVIDVLKWWSGAPFTYAGLNSIVLYCGHNILANYFPINWTVEAVHWKLLLMDTWGTAFWVIVAYILFRKKIFISL